ncbi:hypothetical protein Amal_03718 [Acetobacter malorum]|uniref:Uncharacterized protein n=1 Tax=Acetobacter malorum TaxID=178901 RepID=A0A177G6F5_9PROT|nr:hypothetical protein [Acetobacter malorum]OAG75117.1 hypothetical protein Amal_03718 [Acetobacter malorum]
MRKIAFIVGCLAATSVHAQSTGIPWVNGRVLTAPMLQTLDQAKMNINSLGKPGFAPQLNSLGQITNPVVGDVSQAKATSDGQTVVQVTAKAANAVQKTDIGEASGVAPLDASKMMSAPVSGDVSPASAEATFPGSAPRKMSSIVSDTKNLRNYGIKLDDSQINTDMGMINSLWSTTPRLLHVPSGSIWPHNGGNAIVPNSPNGNIVVQAEGEINLWPSYPVSAHGIGFPIPYFGDGVTSILYGANASVAVSRVDANNIGFNSGLPNYSFNYMADTTQEPGNAGVPGMVNVRLHSVAGVNKRGMMAGKNDIFDSLAMGGFGDDDVQNWHHMGIWGTDWTWSNIREVNQYIPYFFSNKEDGHYNQATYVNEEDFSTGGPENPEGSYDPTKYNRKMFWLALGHGSMGGTSTDTAGNKSVNIADDVQWKPSASYHRYQEVIVADQSGQPYLFYALSKSYDTNTGSPSDDTSGSSTPAWVFNDGATIPDGNLIWTCIGKFHSDIGVVFGISGDNSPSTGWVSRIGTLMAESDDYIYNSIFDMSKAAFDPAVPYKIFSRLQKDMYLDLTADGTQAGQNNHLLGYSSDGSGLSYILGPNANGTSSASKPFTITDDGVTHISGLKVGDDAFDFSSGRQIVKAETIDGSGVLPNSLSLRYAYPDVHIFVDNSDFGAIQRKDSMSKSAILAISSPQEGRLIYDTDDHTEVQYRCPANASCGWFPVQYGAALSN